jgi:class III cytochrome C family protein
VRCDVRPVLLFLFCLAGAAPAGAQISPGPLARPHQDLEGSLNCNKCHTGRSETMPAKCLACHIEIATRRDQGRGFHAQVKDKACTECHPDHAGRDFQLISWDGGSPETFDHRRSGWPLEGKHAQVACRDCHQAKCQKSAVTAKIRVRPASRSWLGLDTQCVSCHQDVHGGTLASTCESCHTLQGWKPASRFDHARTAYPLTGKHMAVACAKCHSGAPASPGPPSAAAALDLKRFKPVSHNECSACHQDPHKGSLGGTCASCHLTASFQQVNAKSFRHDKTRFPLLGAHATVACEKCHTKPGGGALPKPAFAACRDCHADAHGTQLAGRSDKGACESCHTVAGWRPSTFPPAQHASLRLPLEGRHAEIECRACHTTAATASADLGSAKVRLTWPDAACERCHVDAHRGRWSKIAGGCRSCHDLRSFHHATVDVAMHAGFSYSLEGAHRALPCVACHAELKHDPAKSTLVSAPAGVPALLFDQKRNGCRDCHRNPHGAAFEGPSAKECTRCHDANVFVPAVRFNHDRDSQFPLKGAHAKVPCARCHPTATGQDGKQFVVYRPLDTSCRSCHEGSSLKSQASLEPGPSPKALGPNHGGAP